MTTFTLQELNLPTTADEAVKTVAEMSRVPVLNISDGGRTVHYTTPQFSPEPQTGEVLPNPDLPTIINNICAQLQLLATVISQAKAQPNTTPPEGANLKDCVEQVLQQAVWFDELIKDRVEACVDEEMVREAAKDCVEREVECYFDYRFDVNKHFDFNEAIHDAVSDQIDSAVSDQIDDKLEEVVAEKLSEASVSISF